MFTHEAAPFIVWRIPKGSSGCRARDPFPVSHPESLKRTLERIMMLPQDPWLGRSKLPSRKTVHIHCHSSEKLDKELTTPRRVSESVRAPRLFLSAASVRVPLVCLKDVEMRKTTSFWESLKGGPKSGSRVIHELMAKPIGNWYAGGRCPWRTT